MILYTTREYNFISLFTKSFMIKTHIDSEISFIKQSEFIFIRLSCSRNSDDSRKFKKKRILILNEINDK